MKTLVLFISIALIATIFAAQEKCATGEELIRSKFGEYKLKYKFANVYKDGDDLTKGTPIGFDSIDKTSCGSDCHYIQDDYYDTTFKIEGVEAENAFRIFSKDKKTVFSWNQRDSGRGYYMFLAGDDDMYTKGDYQYYTLMTYKDSENELDYMDSDKSFYPLEVYERFTKGGTQIYRQGSGTGATKFCFVKARNSPTEEKFIDKREDKIPTYIIAHAINAVYEIDLYMTGANAMESDLQFSYDGSLYEFKHTIPCDAFRNGLASSSVDEMKEEVVKRFKHRPDSMVMWQLDLKISQFEGNQTLLEKTGANLALFVMDVLDKTIDSNKRGMKILMGLENQNQILFARSFVSKIREETNHSQYMDRIGWDMSMPKEGWSKSEVVSYLKQELIIDAEHIWVSTGLTNWDPRTFYRWQVNLDECLLQRKLKNASRAYFWTVDKQNSIQQFLSQGADGIITNNVYNALYVLNRFKESHYLATIDDNPFSFVPRHYETGRNERDETQAAWCAYQPGWVGNYCAKTCSQLINPLLLNDEVSWCWTNKSCSVDSDCDISDECYSKSQEDKCWDITDNHVSCTCEEKCFKHNKGNSIDSEPFNWCYLKHFESHSFNNESACAGATKSNSRSGKYWSRNACLNVGDERMVSNNNDACYKARITKIDDSSITVEWHDKDEGDTEKTTDDIERCRANDKTDL